MPTSPRLLTLSAAIAVCFPWAASAQLDEILVTATRRETNLQDTPISIQAFTSEQLELSGINNGRDLGIMVPNVVLNPSVGGATEKFYIRGLPGVGIYVDGVWQGGFGFQQMDFAETERIEVLRGPQGTLFGRNTNGGAVNITTKRPADQFGARVKLNVGDFGRREAQLAVDLPLSDTFKTKFTGATFQNDGFMEGLTTPWDFGAQDDTILRFDALWEPTDNFSLRFTHNDEDKNGTDPKAHRMTRYDNSKIYAYNVMLGAFQDQANAVCAADLARCAAIAAGGALVGETSFFTGTGWAPPPDPEFGTRHTGVASPGFNYTTHMTDYKGGISSAYGDVVNGVYVPNPYLPDVVFGPGVVGKWQTKSDSADNGIRADVKYSTLTANWEIRSNLQLEVLLSTVEQNRRQVVDFDGTEFIITTDDIPELYESDTIELHLSGSALDGRIGWLAGYYNLKEELTRRTYRWGMYEFVIPSTAQVVNGFSVRSALNVQYNEYVRQTALLLGLNGVTGGNLLTSDSAAAGQARYPWNNNISSDALVSDFDDDEAWFGEATFGVTDKLDLTVGARLSDKSGGDNRYQPLGAFRTADPEVRPQGDPFAGSLISTTYDPDQPRINTYKFGVSYKPTAATMVYATYTEGFTSAESPVITIGPNSVVPPGGTRVSPTQAIIPVPAEVVTNKEIGLRSDWLDNRLRFNASYFDALWEGMRVTLRPFDAQGNTQPFPYQSGEGKGTASGFEFQLVWLATDRLTLDFNLGLIDTEYIQSGVFDGVNGNRPGSSFAYAADESASLGVQYDVPLGNGGRVLLVGNYGYTGDYARDAAYQRTLIDANGDPILEPGYGILNSRVVYEPAERNYSVELWGKNLLDERYLNGGYDTRDTWGYDFGVVGRSREVGVGISFEF